MCSRIIATPRIGVRRCLEAAGRRREAGPRLTRAIRAPIRKALVASLLATPSSDTNGPRNDRLYPMGGRTRDGRRAEGTPSGR